MPTYSNFSLAMNRRCPSCLNSAQMPVIAGFGIMILLLMAVAAIGVSHIRILSGQLTAIVAERNLKAELATFMKSLHDERYQAILLASELDDPFERDEQTMRFSDLAKDFIVARDRFLALPLSQAELAAWERVRKELPAVEAVANEAIELLQADRQVLAKQRIRSDLRLHQALMMKQWDALVDMQRVSNAQAVVDANSARDRARSLVLGLSAVALLVAFGVAFFVIRLSRRLETDLFEERERALVTLRSIGDAVIRFDQERMVSYLNPVAESLLGLSGLESRSVDEGLPTAEVLHLFERETRSDLTDTLLYDVLKGTPYLLPPYACLLSGQGMEYEVEGKCSPIHTPEGGIIGGVLVMSDVTEARELQRKLLWHSDHDALTGLVNRHAFEEHLTQSLGSKRAAQLPMSLLLISLDQIRKVSEGAGHAGSDEMLRQLANMMSLRVRDSDLLARLGHDEFAVLLQSCPIEKADRIARQIRDSVLGFHLSWDNRTYQVGVYIGVVHLTHQTEKECLSAAYAACQEARTHGPGSVVVHQQGPLMDEDRPDPGVQPDTV